MPNHLFWKTQKKPLAYCLLNVWTPGSNHPSQNTLCSTPSGRSRSFSSLHWFHLHIMFSPDKQELWRWNKNVTLSVCFMMTVAALRHHECFGCFIVRSVFTKAWSLVYAPGGHYRNQSHRGHTLSCYTTPCVSGLVAHDGAALSQLHRKSAMAFCWTLCPACISPHLDHDNNNTHTGSLRSALNWQLQALFSSLSPCSYSGSWTSIGLFFKSCHVK